MPSVPAPPFMDTRPQPAPSEYSIGEHSVGRCVVVSPPTTLDCATFLWVCKAASRLHVTLTDEEAWQIARALLESGTELLTREFVARRKADRCGG